MSSVGEQLELFEGGLTVVRIPWEGRSPRALTRVGLGITLKAQAAKSVSDFVRTGQYDLWLAAEEGPPIYRGAPCLLPMPRR